MSSPSPKPNAKANDFSFFKIDTKYLLQKVSRSANSQDSTPFQTADFTILSGSLNANSPLALAYFEMTMSVFKGTPIRELICLQPQRLIRNEILAQLQAKVRLDKTLSDSETFNEAFQLIEKSIADESDTFIRDTGPSLYLDAQKDAECLYELMLEGGDIDELINERAQQLSDLDSRLLARLYQQLTPQDEQQALSASMKKAVFIARVLPIIYRQRAATLLEPLISRAIESTQLPMLDYLQQDNVAVFTTGGVASGKGTSLSRVTTILEAQGVRYDMLVHHNADRLKPFLLEPKTPETQKAYSQYTYEEALMIKERTMAIINAESALKNGAMPHFLHDQTKLKKQELMDASRCYAKVIVLAVSTSADNAIRRSFKRGVQTKRFEHTEGLLGSHKAVPSFFMDALDQEALFGKDIEVTMMDNNGESPQMFASIKLLTKDIIIYDRNRMNLWIKKLLINTQANSFDTLYSSGTAKSIEAYFQALTDKGFTLQYPEVTNAPGTVRRVS